MDNTFSGGSQQGMPPQSGGQSGNQQSTGSQQPPMYQPVPSQQQGGMSSSSSAGAQPPAYQPAANQGMQPPVGQQGAQPASSQPSGGDTSSPPKPPSPPANFQLGAKLAPVLRIKVPPHTLKFDEQYFLHLLAGSISLTKDEKARIIESIPKLKQSQIDELVRIFEEERRKFAELGAEHTPQLEKLAQQHYEDWVDIEMKQEQGTKAEEDAAKAEEIRKQLGL